MRLVVDSTHITPTTSAVHQYPPMEILIKIPFPTARHAEIAYDVLRLDAEPKRNFVTKTLLVEKHLLVVTFSGATAKNLRVGVTAFFEALVLSCETMDKFGPPAPQYTHY